MKIKTHVKIISLFAITAVIASIIDVCFAMYKIDGKQINQKLVVAVRQIQVEKEAQVINYTGAKQLEYGHSDGILTTEELTLHFNFNETAYINAKKTNPDFYKRTCLVTNIDFGASQEATNLANFIWQKTNFDKTCVSLKSSMASMIFDKNTDYFYYSASNSKKNYFSKNGNVISVYIPILDSVQAYPNPNSQAYYIHNIKAGNGVWNFDMVLNFGILNKELNYADKFNKNSFANTIINISTEDMPL